MFTIHSLMAGISGGIKSNSALLPLGGGGGAPKTMGGPGAPVLSDWVRDGATGSCTVSGLAEGDSCYIFGLCSISDPPLPAWLAGPVGNGTEIELDFSAFQGVEFFGFEMNVPCQGFAVPVSDPSNPSNSVPILLDLNGELGTATISDVHRDPADQTILHFTISDLGENDSSLIFYSDPNTSELQGTGVTGIGEFTIEGLREGEDYGFTMLTIRDGSTILQPLMFYSKVLLTLEDFTQAISDTIAASDLATATELAKVVGKLPTHYLAGAASQSDLHDAPDLSGTVALATELAKVVNKLPTNYIAGKAAVTDLHDAPDLTTPLANVAGDVTTIKNNIGTPVALDAAHGGLATLGNMLAQMAESASFLKSTDSLNKIKAAIGTPVALDGGLATIGGMLTRIVDDTNGGSHFASGDDLHSIAGKVTQTNLQIAAAAALTAGGIATATDVTTAQGVVTTAISALHNAPDVSTNVGLIKAKTDKLKFAAGLGEQPIDADLTGIALTTDITTAESNLAAAISDLPDNDAIKADLEYVIANHSFAPGGEEVEGPGGDEL